MTLIEFLVIFLFLGAGIAGGVTLSGALGWIGWPAGFAAGMFCLYGFGRALGYLEYLLTGRPGMPPCESGACSGKGRRHFEGYEDEYDRKRETTIYTCRCRYEYIRQGKAIHRCLAGGADYPVVVWVPFRGWRSVKLAHDDAGESGAG